MFSSWRDKLKNFTSRLVSDMNWPSKLMTQNGLVLDFSKPPEYNGLHGTMTPEDAFVSSVLMCLATTFETYASKMRLNVTNYESEGTGTVDRVDGVVKFSEIRVKVRITIPLETKKASIQKAIDRARETCLVTASMNTSIDYDVQIITNKNEQ